MFRPLLFAVFGCLGLLIATPFAAIGQQNTTIQLPQFGVAVDADGVLSLKTFRDPRGALTAKRLAAARDELPADVFAPAKMRKVSLVRLEQAIKKRLDAGDPPDDVMRHVAGLQRVQYVFFYPDRRDIVIAGPAEGWINDLSGRAVGVTTGRPVILLEDLLVALRAYAPGTRNRPFIGCSIDPDRNGLERLRAFQQTVPRVIPQRQRGAVASYIAKGSRDALGMANIRVFGISNRTHFAQVLIEADYRMKLIGIGLEAPPVKMVTFIGALSRPQHATLQRWWFTPNYECVKVSKDRLAMEMVGQGVKLHGEDKLIGPDGQLVNKNAKPNKASDLFTTAFTKKYEEISARSPVYAQMRNMVDMLVAAAFIRQQDYYRRADRDLGVLGKEAALPVETFPDPKKVPAAVNVLWKGSRLMAPAGGGVSIHAEEALKPDRLREDENNQLAGQHQNVDGAIPENRWWWD